MAQLQLDDGEVVEQEGKRGGQNKAVVLAEGRRKEGIHTRFVRLQRSSSSELGWVVK